MHPFLLMMQKHLPQPFNPQVPTKPYPSLSILPQYYTHTTKLLTLPKTLFIPPPNLHSILLKFIQRQQPLLHLHHQQPFFNLPNPPFPQPPKTINNNYQNFFKHPNKNKQTIPHSLQTP
ncbi:rRNA adenine N-6-methyltransferase family protein, partial [Staphylococcus epidermidis]|uniref:rRNA adenine N-6-methyltransferase family protein n=1 Tax=Staphylococcus epidermidis TaxID=1282 RepID=UPI0037DA122A